MEARIIELETKLAFQDQSLRELDDALTSQQQQLDVLTRQLARLQQQLIDMTDNTGANQGAVEIPPHY